MVKAMSKASFQENPRIRTALRYFLVLQIGSAVIVFLLILLKLQSLAFLLSLATFAVFIVALVLLCLSYSNHPIVQQKRALIQQIGTLQAGILSERMAIQTAEKTRGELTQAKRNEIQHTLESLQKSHIQRGLETSYLKDAAIPGIGPKLKEKLAAHGIVSAAQVSGRVSEMPGFGQAKQQALTGWKALVHVKLDSTKPTELPSEDSEVIENKYKARHATNDEVERSAQTTKQTLENDLTPLLPTLESLSSITFLSFLNKSLASQGLVAGFIGVVLILSQGFSGVSATTAAIVASIPTATQTATATLTPTNTLTPTITFTPTVTPTPTITNTPTITDTPTSTFTPTITFTPTKTNTPRPTITKTPLPTSTLSVGGGGGGGGGSGGGGSNGRVRTGALCNDGTTSSATGRGACSHHGGVKCWYYSDGSCTLP